LPHSKRRAALAAAAAITALPLVLAGCSAGSGGSSDSALTIQDYYDTTHDAIYNGCASDVGVKIKIDHIPYDGLMPKVLQQASSKTLPDVLMLDLPNIAEIAKSGALAPLDQFKVSTTGMADGIVKAGSYKGKLYGLAPAVNTLALFYNKDLFAQAGIQTPPTTWAEMKADAKTLTSGDRYGIGLSTKGAEDGTWEFLPFMWSNGADEDAIDSPKAVEALEYVKSLQDDGVLSKSSVAWDQTAVDEQFIAGKAAMQIAGPYQIPTIQKSKVNWGSVPIPSPTGAPSVTPLGGEGFTVPQTGDADKMAKSAKFVECLNSPKNQEAVAKLSETVPSDTATASEMGKSDATLAAFITAVRTARSRTAIVGDQWPATSKRIYTAVQLAMTGKATPAEALKTAQNEKD